VNGAVTNFPNGDFGYDGPVATISTDGRGRVTLPVKNATFELTELPGGTLMLEPARVLTQAEYEVLLNPELRQQVTASMNDPEAATRHVRRSERVR